MEKKIKKIIGIAACMLLLAAAAQSQVIMTTERDHSDYDGSMLLGIRYMPTFSDFDIKKSDGGAVETEFVLGHGVGALIGGNFSNHIGLQAEVIYSALAQQYRDGSLDHKVHLDYISVPLMLTLNTHYSSPVNLNVAFGPQFSANVGSKVTTTGTPDDNNENVHAVLAVKPADIGFAYGAGLDFGSAAFKVSLGYRGVIGLLDISDTSDNITTDEYYILDRSHVNTYAGYIGLTFGFLKTSGDRKEHVLPATLFLFFYDESACDHVVKRLLFFCKSGHQITYAKDGAGNDLAEKTT
jgi:hypothetical protein